MFIGSVPIAPGTATFNNQIIRCSDASIMNLIILVNVLQLPDSVHRGLKW